VHRAYEMRPPAVADGLAMWRLAHEAGGLDANTAYAYVLWCRDFASTSIVAESDHEVIGFVTGYRRPGAPDTLFVWQVAVHPHHRGCGIAGGMLDALLARVAPEGVSYLEATVTPSNEGSLRTFGGVARRAGAPLAYPVEGGFDTEVLPEGHEAELVLRIGPVEAG
jgi:L-2,4-diaminobutyric acid acetyltransferase